MGTTVTKLWDEWMGVAVSMLSRQVNAVGHTTHTQTSYAWGVHESMMTGQYVTLVSNDSPPILGARGGGHEHSSRDDSSAVPQAQR
jgi:hypothetical protein